MNITVCPHCNMRMVPTSDGRCVSCHQSLTAEVEEESTESPIERTGEQGDEGEDEVTTDDGYKSAARKIALCLFAMALFWFFNHPHGSQRATDAIDAVIGDPPELYDIHSAAILFWLIPAIILFGLSFARPSGQRLFFGCIGAGAASYFALIMLFSQTATSAIPFGIVGAFCLYFAFKGFHVSDEIAQNS